MKKVCLIITGQMRTYKKCFDNILKNILSNKEYIFHIYIFTEYYGVDGGTLKNKFVNTEDNILDFEKNIKKTYGKYLKSIIIDCNNKINYPKYLNKNDIPYGPWICLYKNKLLFDSIKNLDDYDLFIRLRPDIILTDVLNLGLHNIDNTIHIICSKKSRNNSWFHNRDWDHLCISNKKGMELWCDYYKFLKYNPPYVFKKKIEFNNKGFWNNEEKNDKSVIATQLFVEYIKNKNYKINFDAYNIHTNPIRN